MPLLGHQRTQYLKFFSEHDGTLFALDIVYTKDNVPIDTNQEATSYLPPPGTFKQTLIQFTTHTHSSYMLIAVREMHGRVHSN